ncbi:MAG: hypothetical protein B7733_12715 [Myxococcales bacterium FL481]|nr:MAG: hypothetical protein B7733_12715 [Myxococcales bacterium FL481]
MEDLEYSFRTPASAASLFDAVSTEAGHRAWWAMDCDVGATVGAPCVMRFNKDGTLVTMKFRVDELVNNERVRWTCTDNDNPAWKGSTLTWHIESTGDERRLRLVHGGLALGGPPYEMTKAGWRRFLDSLQGYVEGRGGDPMPGMPAT